MTEERRTIGGINSSLISGRFDPRSITQFVEFIADWGAQKLYLQREVHEAFLRMKRAAGEDSVHLFIVSAFRSFDRQREIWEDKWTGRENAGSKNLKNFKGSTHDKACIIMEYTAPPGYSRHHWGTDIDINSVEPDYFDTAEGKRVYDWLNRRAGAFGFCQTYTAFSAQRPGGFNEEKWHWSYEPLSYPIWSAQLKQFEHRLKYRFKGYRALSRIDLFEYLRCVNHCSGLAGQDAPGNENSPLP